jgi:long-chain acyl-CoA synthetase
MPVTGKQWQSVVHMLFEQTDRFDGRPFLWAKAEGRYRPVSWRHVADDVVTLARGLAAIGLERGDRVVIVSENRPEWLIADFAIMAAGGVTVPAYTTNTEADHQHILDNCGAAAVIVSGRRLASRLLTAVARVPSVRFVVSMEALEPKQQAAVDVHAWADVMRRGADSTLDVLAAAQALTRVDLACIIYTSGTGGAPKGVMQSHGALLHNCAGAADALRALDLDRTVYLSYLPLSHSYEHTNGQFFAMAVGAQIYYAEGVETLLTNMTEAQPTIMAAVPRLFETMHQRTLRGLRKAGPVRRALFAHALALGKKRYRHPDGLSLLDRLIDPVLDRLVRARVRQLFGGGLRALVSGGGALNPELGLFFQALGLPVLQGYGQTESAPTISVNRPGRSKIHTVGPPLIDTEVRIADDGEILVRGELVMLGYWNNAEATRAALRDGWLYTGDIGRFDEDGHLVITDRKKDILVNAGGDNLSPARIEGMLTLEPEIAQAMVYGDGRPHVVALLVPDAEWLRSWARGAGKSATDDLAADGDLRGVLGAAVDRVNRQLSVIERVRRFVVTTEPFTIDNGQLTPTMKIRRHVIGRTYRDALDKLYD